jgi:hypothetical protein
MRGRVKFYSIPGNIEKRKEKERLRWLKNKAEITLRRQTPEAKAKRREWYDKHKLRLRQYYKMIGQMQRDTLHPTYVKKILAQEFGLSAKEIANEMVLLKRYVLFINRKANNSKIDNIRKKDALSLIEKWENSK